MSDKEIWILVLTMPSGAQCILAERENTLALFPLSKELQKGPTELKGVLAFDTEAEALRWISETSTLNIQGAKLMDHVKPMLIKGAVN